MKLVEERILNEGTIINDEIVKVDSFVNHQIDTDFTNQVGKYFANCVKDKNITKILTIETSGLAIAITTALNLGNIPVVFAKKSKSKIVDDSNVFATQIKSFTRGTVSDVTVDKRFLKKEDRVLIVDDFLAEGNAAKGLIDLCNQAGSKIFGFCAIVSKKYQGGEDLIASYNIPVFTGASIKKIVNNKPEFQK